MGVPLRVGIIGAGVISAQYSASFAALPQVAVSAVADLDPARASALADQHEGARAMTVAQLLEDDAVDVVLNLTLPATHAEVALEVLAHGKHVYGEKPLAATAAEARPVLAAATGGLRVGCAPDTVLGPGLQTARAVVDSGRIGTPHSATAVMTAPGHELWHAAPEFYYRPGGGPLLDMGPYYLSALVHLLGPVVRVTGFSGRSLDERSIHTGPRAGTTFGVEVDTHQTGVLQHASGALTTLLMSFDVWGSRQPPIEVHGSEGSLSVPDPNHFGGLVEVTTREDRDWREVEHSAGYTGAGRGIGLADLALALEEGREHRAAAEVALHVLDVVEGLAESAATGAAVALGTTCERPAAVAGLVALA